jgi:hypothetical protein
VATASERRQRQQFGCVVPIIHAAASSNVRSGSYAEMLRLSISRRLFLAKADADRPWPGATSVKTAAPTPPGTSHLGLVEAIGHPAARAVGRRAPVYSITSSARRMIDGGYRKAERLGGVAVHVHLKFFGNCIAVNGRNGWLDLQ